MHSIAVLYSRVDFNEIVSEISSIKSAGHLDKLIYKYGNEAERIFEIDEEFEYWSESIAYVNDYILNTKRITTTTTTNPNPIAFNTTTTTTTDTSMMMTMTTTTTTTITTLDINVPDCGGSSVMKTFFTILGVLIETDRRLNVKSTWNSMRYKALKLTMNALSCKGAITPLLRLIDVIVFYLPKMPCCTDDGIFCIACFIQSGVYITRRCINLSDYLTHENSNVNIIE